MKLKDSPHVEMYREYIRDSLKLIRLALDEVARGEVPAYRIIAVQLRMLLCDRKREHNQMTDSALLPLVIPSVHLNALQPDLLPMPLNDWLDQVIHLSENDSTTIREMIKTICERDGGAHVDFSGIAVSDIAAVRRKYQEMGRVLCELSAPLVTEIEKLL